MLKIGLTGSIAVGKTFVAKVLIELGCPVLDADQTAREVVAPGTIGWQKIVEAFGREILSPDETLNRAFLGKIVFADREKRELLNSIVHPLVIDAQNRWLEQLESRQAHVAVIDAALMIESGSFRRFDIVTVVWCAPEIQIERLMQRDNLTREAALQRINAQMSQEEKKKHADFLIDTSNDFAETRRQVEKVYRQFLSLKIK